MTFHNQTPRPTGVVPRWIKRFADALDGIRLGAQDQESLWAHLVITVVVILLGFALQIEAWQWCAVIICIALVIALELMNSAIEQLVKTLHPEHDAGLAAVLHMAAGSVLVAAIGSVVIGIIVFLPPLLRWL